MAKKKYRKTNELMHARAIRIEQCKLARVPEEYQYRAMALVRDYAMDINMKAIVAARAQVHYEMALHMKLPDNALKVVKAQYDEAEHDWHEILNEAMGLESENFMISAIDNSFDGKHENCPLCNPDFVHQIPRMFDGL